MTDKLDGLSMDIEAENKARLQSIFPECFTEGKLEVDKLLSLCGEYITDDYEKYEFKWKGKSDCIRLAQRRSTATLRPCLSESVNFDTTQNLYIEGDNLEVLKLLQKSYFRKVKMIYIDPPYNTGNDFVYEDDFADPMRRYVEVTRQTTRSNPETMGRYHTNWLNMMYPRLRLAANLLQDDGVIFISIDEIEMPNLRKICDEILGEENHIADFVWHNKRGGGNDAKYVAVEHEYVIMYAKSVSNLDRLFVPFSKDYLARYKEEDEIGKYFWDTFKRKSGKQYYPITCPDGTILEKDEFGNPISWLRSEPRFKEDIANGEIRIIKINNKWSVQFKQRIPEGKKPRTIFLEESIFENQGTTGDGSSEVLQLFSKNLFSNPKPINLIKHLLTFDTNNNDIILDFFSGSATTAHAVMQLNAENGGNRRFICVQLPEVCDEKSEAYKAGYENICEIGKERIRRAGTKILETLDKSKPFVDVGFKVFKLDTSNMKLWDDTPIEDGDVAALFDRIDGHIDGLKPDRSDEDLVYEILLKMGYPLTAGITAADVGGLTVYKVEGGTMLVCLQEGVTAEHIEQMAALSPQKIVLAGRGLADSSTKANAFYLLENKGIDLETV